MKTLLSWAIPAALIAGCVTGVAEESKKAGFVVGNEDRVVIYGDSITAGYTIQTYPRYIETYIRTRYPDWKGEAWNRGLSGDGAGNAKRYQAECLALKPTIITFNMGMNDISPTDSFGKSLGRFVTNLVARVTETQTNYPNAKIFLCSPIPYETRTLFDGTDKMMSLRVASRFERQVAEKMGVSFIDVNRAMYENVGITEAYEPNTMTFSNDAVHPGNQGGHFLMAVAFLEGMGAQPHLAEAEIDAASTAVRLEKDVKISDVKVADGRVSFVRTLAHLPFPAVCWQEDAMQAYADREMYGRFRIADRLNRDILRVTGLTAAAYELKIDGRTYAIFAREELSEGINLGEFCSAPDFERACRLSDAIGLKHIAQAELLVAEKAANQEKIAAAQKKLEACHAGIAKVSHAEPRTIELVPFEGKFDRWNREQEGVDFWFGSHWAGRFLGGWYTLKADKDGRFRGKEKVRLENLADHERVVEAVFPEGFTPAAIVRKLGPREKYSEEVSYDLPPDVPGCSAILKHYRSDLLSTPLTQQVNFYFARHAKFAKGADGSLKLTVALRPEGAGDRARWLGPADCSATATVEWKAGRMSVNIDALDQDHVNAYTNSFVSWDDSLSFVFGKKSYILAWTKAGKKILPEKAAADVQYEVKREGFHTRYSLSFPCEEPKATETLSFSIFDRDSDQQAKAARWSGVVDP